MLVQVGLVRVGQVFAKVGQSELDLGEICRGNWRCLTRVSIGGIGCDRGGEGLQS